MSGIYDHLADEGKAIDSLGFNEDPSALTSSVLEMGGGGNSGGNGGGTKFSRTSTVKVSVPGIASFSRTYRNQDR